MTSFHSMQMSNCDTCPAVSLFVVDPFPSPLQAPRMARSLIYFPDISIPTQPPGPSPLRPQAWPAAAPPGQQLFGLVCEDGTVGFHHAGQRGGDPSLQKPLHTHVYEVLLVLGR